MCLVAGDAEINLSIPPAIVEKLRNKSELVYGEMQSRKILCSITQIHIY